MFGFLPIGGKQFWTPKSPGNLLGWYDAATGVSSSSGLVTSWADQSGNSYNLTPNGGAPGYSATGWDGTLPAVSFNGAGQFLQNTGGLSSYIAGGSHSNPLTIFGIIDSATIGASINTFISWDDSPTLANIANYYINTSQHLAISYGGASLKVDGTTTATGSKKSIGYFTGSDGYFNSYVGNTLDMNHTGPLVISMITTTRVLLGLNWTGNSSSYNGKLAEFAIYSAKLNANDYFSFYDYARLKWNANNAL